MKRLYPITFDPVKVVAAFGGIHKTHHCLAEAGCGISYRAVRKWLERGVVPGDAIVALHLYAVSNDGPDVMALAEYKTNGEAA